MASCRHPQGMLVIMAATLIYMVEGKKHLVHNPSAHSLPPQ